MVTGTGWGMAWAIGFFGALFAGISLTFGARATAGWLLAAVGGLAICVSEALTGHSGTAPHYALSIAADVSHQLGTGGWLGGLLALVLVGLPAARQLDEPRSAEASTGLLRAYHSAAVECVVITLAGALLLAWLRLPRVSDLWTSGYGRLILGKIMLLIILLAFGFYHNRTVVRREWSAAGGRRFRFTAGIELVFAAMVIALSAILVSTLLPQ
jgi:copper transport protein